MSQQFNEESAYLTQQQQKASTLSSPGGGGLAKTIGASSAMVGQNSANRRPELQNILDPSKAGTQQNWIMDNISAFTSPKKVTAKQLVSQYFGFGNIQLENMNQTQGNLNRTVTGLEGSGKFGQKLHMKQKQIEAQMLENRLRKLHNEEQRLQKQIRIAQKHSEFADQVKQRRDEDNAMMNWHKMNVQQNEDMQRETNYARRNANIQGIRSHTNRVLANNSSIRQNLKAQSQDLANQRFQARYMDQDDKINRVNNSLNNRRNASDNKNMNRANYNNSVSMAHQDKAAEHERIRQANEMRIKQLEEIEQRMVNDLQNTLQMKNTAMNELAGKSKGLKKVMQPRMAYKYAPREQSTGNLLNMQAQSQYAFSGRNNSNATRTEAINTYNRRSKSIVAGTGPMSPAAGPSSGNIATNFMTNDTSATQLKDINNEMYVTSPSQQPKIVPAATSTQPAQQAATEEQQRPAETEEAQQQ